MEGRNGRGEGEEEEEGVGMRRRRKEGGGGMTDGKTKERNTGGGSSEGKGDRAKGVEGGVGRIGLGAMKKTTGRRETEIWKRRVTYPGGEMLQDEPELVSWNAPFVILIVFRSSSY